MYPLRFEPLFRRYIWGGRRLATLLNKPIGQQPCAESWEIVDHNDDQSIVQYGKHKGKSLSELIHQHGTELMGESVFDSLTAPNVPTQLKYRFPLLLKFLDAHKNLSVQVHPDDKLAATLTPPDFGKTEAWYVMHADLGSTIYAGIRQGVTQPQFAAAIENGTCEELLHSFQPQPGDCVFIPAGTMHAIGAGLLIAEIQQSSDTTFRVFDWNRTDANGNSRELHIKQSLRATHFDLGPVNPTSAIPTNNEHCDTLVQNDKFIIRKWRFDHPIEITDDSMHLLAVTKGQLKLEHDPSGQPMSIGETALIPAVCNRMTITPQSDTEVLDIFIPT